MSDYFNYLINVFEDTRDKSRGMYLQDTLKTIKGTKCIAPHNDELVFRYGNQKITFLNHTRTLEAAKIYRSKGNTVAVLNFADALLAGGYVDNGGVAQEETLCRCSNLYEALVSNNAKEYYLVNKRHSSSKPTKLYYGDFREGVYTDYLIYSPSVKVFKSDIDYSDIKPFDVDVISCPAPFTILTEDKAIELYTRRIRHILVATQNHNVDTIILGAWGCGAFGQDPIVMGKSFALELNKCNGAFKNVVFAVLGEDNFTALKTGFEMEYKYGNR